MGFTYVTVRVYSIDLTKWEDVEVLVDSGALLTSIPRSVLERLGFKPIARRKLRVYSGNLVERDIGGAVVEYEGQRAIAPVIFGEEGDIPVLGGYSPRSSRLPDRPHIEEVEANRATNGVIVVEPKLPPYNNGVTLS